MADTNTSTITATTEILVKPEPGASPDTWGTKLNANLDKIVSGLNTIWTAVTGKLTAASNLSDLASASTARTNLGVAIGSNVQGYSALLQSVSGLSFTTGSYIYGTGTNTAAVGTITSTARTFLAAADTTAMRAAIGAVIGTNVQAYSAALGSLSGASANGVSLVTAPDYAAMRSALGLVIGSSVQAFNGNLTALSGLTLVADRLPYADGSGTLSLATFTSAGRSMIAAADAAAQKTLLSLQNVENKSSSTIRGELSSSNVTTALGYTPTSITGYTGAQSPSAIKSALSITKGDLGLGNVENKSAATIRDEAVAYLGAERIRTITLSTSDPSGGSDGDVWLKYTA